MNHGGRGQREREEIDEILTDAYGEDEQFMAWEVAITDEVGTPFKARLLGTSVEVHGFRVGRADNTSWTAVDTAATIVFV